LLSTREVQGVFLELVLDLVPEVHLFEALLDDLLGFSLDAVEPSAPEDVLLDGLGEGIGLLEDHADPSPELYGVHLRRVDVSPVDRISPATRPRDEVVHAVECAQAVDLPHPEGP
jgi:hypothetical protein